MSSGHKSNTLPAPVASTSRSLTPLGPRADDRSSQGGSDRYILRDRSQDRRRDYERDVVMDGSYGFDESIDTDDRGDNRRDNGRGRGLYSDNLIGGRGRGHGNSRVGANDSARGFR
jgi:hypothetical protein